MSTVAGILAAVTILLALRPRPSTPRSAHTTRRRSRGERAGRFGPAAVAGWAADLARELRAGTTLRGALGEVVPGDPALAQATDALRLELRRGADLTAAVDRLPDDPHLGLVHGVVRACATVGGAAAPPLERAAATLRGRAADLEDRAAQSAQARLSARVMTLLPLATLGFLAATDSGVRAVVGSPAGLFCVSVGAAANAAGWWWMNRIVRAHTWAG